MTREVGRCVSCFIYLFLSLSRCLSHDGIRNLAVGFFGSMMQGWTYLSSLGLLVGWLFVSEAGEKDEMTEKNFNVTMI